MIRFAGGNLTVFDQNGAPVPSVSPTTNVPMYNPLALLGNNPGASPLSQLVVSNIQQQAQATNSQLSYSGPHALLSRAIQDTGPSATAQWTYTPSGNLWIATQLALAVSPTNRTGNIVLQFANLAWNDNASADATRSSQGTTGSAPPAPTNSTPGTLAMPSPPSGCVPYLSSQGGSQNVVFQHGFLSNGCTWNRMVPWLNQHFLFGTELIPSLNSIDSLSSQGNALVSDMDSAGGSGYILIGHSQGGLISRYAAQHYQTIQSNKVRGVLTLDTPHKGAPIAGIPTNEINDVLAGDQGQLWGALGCLGLYDNVLCYLVGEELSTVPQIADIGALSDLAPGSTFLNNLNSQPETFLKAAVISNTPKRWIEARVATSAFGCNPEDSCGERNVAHIVQISYDSLIATAGISELLCYLEGYQIACKIADIVLRIIHVMNTVDSDYNLLTDPLGGNQDGFVPSYSQNYPSDTAVQYNVSHADSHMDATKSDLARDALEKALEQQFNIPTQASCTFTGTPSVDSISMSGGSGSFTLSTAGGCQWSATSQTAWLSLTSSPSGTSGTDISFTAQANPVSASRQGVIRVGNGDSQFDFTVSQAAFCTYSLSGGSTLAVPPSGGTETVSVVTQAGCTWSAVSNASWLTVTAGSGGTGSGAFTFTAAPNSTGEDISGTITVMDQTLTVIVGSPAGTPGTGSVTIEGAETTYQGPPTPSSSTVYVAGENYGDFGTVSVVVGSYEADANYQDYDQAYSVAQYLADALNGSGLVTAYASNVTSGVASVTMTSVAGGSDTDYSVSCYASSDFEMSPCPDMDGGSDGNTTYATGSVSITVGGFRATAIYGANSTSTSVAAALANSLNASNSPVTAVANAGIISIASKVNGDLTNYTISTSYSFNAGEIGSPPFQAEASGMQLTGGTD